MTEAAKFLNPPSLDLTVQRYNDFKQWMTKWRDYKVLTKPEKKRKTRRTPECNAWIHVFNRNKTHLRLIQPK